MDAQPKDPQQPEYRDHLVVCAGVVDLVGGERGVAFFTLTPDVTDERHYFGTATRHVFSAKKRMRDLVVGGVYTLAGTEDLSTIRPAPTYVRMFADEPQVVAWRTASRAVELARQVKARLAKAKRRDYLAELLEPIRREYSKAVGLNRLAIEVEVLRALRS